MKHAARIPPLATLLCRTLGTVAFLLLAPEHAIGEATLLGPTPYLSRADSPFDTSAFGFCVEDFENGRFDVPGTTPTGHGGAAKAPSSTTDSVDADDGTIDGSGAAGTSLTYDGFDGIFSGPLFVDFDPDRTNGLPTQVGIVWTDGSVSATFSAYGPSGELLVGVNGPNAHADTNNDGATAEDRFYGVTNPAGISRIAMSGPDQIFEVDHLQLNRCILCGDTDSDLDVDATDVLSALNVAVGLGTCNPCICDADGDGGTRVSDARAILRKAIGNVFRMDCPACEGL